RVAGLADRRCGDPRRRAAEPPALRRRGGDRLRPGDRAGHGAGRGDGPDADRRRARARRPPGPGAPHCDRGPVRGAGRRRPRSAAGQAAGDLRRGRDEHGAGRRPVRPGRRAPVGRADGGCRPRDHATAARPRPGRAPRDGDGAAMRILLVRPTASGGLAAHVDHELALLTAAGQEVAEAPVRIRERPHPLADLRTVRTLRSVLVASPAPVVLHAHGLRAGALSALAVRGRRGRLVVTLHNRTVGSRAGRAVGAVLLRILARTADTVLAVSPDLAEAARRAGAGDVRHAVIPAPAPAGPAPADPQPSAPGAAAGSAARPAADGGEGIAPLEILVIARLAPQKGLPDLLDAAAVLRDGPPVRILVAGDGPLHEELSARIRAEHLPVELLGRRDDVPALLAAADLVVSAARWEGQPVSLQEALRAGRAIVATDAGGTRWVTGEAAALVPVGAPAALAAAISSLAAPAARRAAEAASRRRARDLPTEEHLLAQLDEVLVAGARGW